MKRERQPGETGKVTYYHMGVTPRHLMMLRESGKTWDFILKSRPEGASDEDIARRVREDAAGGIVYPIGSCPTWDEHKGCPGHDKKAGIS